MRTYGKDCLQALAPNEIAGPVTIGSIIKFLREIDTNSDRILIQPNTRGSISIDLVDEADFSGSGSEAATLRHTFMACSDGSAFAVSGGSVRFPGLVLAVDGASYADDGGAGMKYWVHCTKEGAYIDRGADLPAYMDDMAVNLPLMYLNEDGVLAYRHVGDYVFASLPYRWISGYSASEMQSLDHDSSGNLVWTTYGTCQ